MKHIYNYLTLNEVDTTKEYPSPGLIYVDENNGMTYADYGDEATYKVKIVDGKVISYVPDTQYTVNS